MLHPYQMWFGKFFIKSLWLSLGVALYWLPALFVLGYAVRVVFNLFISEPIALGMLIILLFQPLLVLIVVLAVRGGMMALKVTNGADLNKIATVTFKVMKFNIPLIWAIIFLFGMSSTLTAMRIMELTIFADIMAMKNRPESFNLAALISKIGEFPLPLVTGWLLGFVVAFGLMSVSVAGASAMAAARPPSHHTIWGIASEFVNLFLLALVLVFIPFIVFVLFYGGLGSTLMDVFNLPAVVKYAIAGYMTWSICALSAGTSLAYSLTVVNEEETHRAEMEAMAGMTGEKVDLRALRQSRMKD